MKITTRASGNYTILEVDGRLIMGPDTMDLRHAVREAARINPQRIILNLAKVTYADSCGIGELVSSYSHIKGLGGNLVLTDLPGRVRNLLVIAKLAPIFEICDSEQAAIADSRQNKTLRQMCG